MNRRERADLERVPRPERLHRRMLLPEIGIHRGDPLDRRAQILNRRQWRIHDGSVRLADANELNIQLLGRGVVAEDDLPPLLDAGFALRLDAQIQLAPARPVVVETDRGARLFDHRGLFRLRRGRLLTEDRGRTESGEHENREAQAHGSTCNRDSWL